MGVRKMLVSGEEEEEGLRPGHAGLWLLRATGAKQRGQSLVPPRLLPRGARSRLPVRLSQLTTHTPMFLKLRNKFEIKY